MGWKARLAILCIATVHLIAPYTIWTVVLTFSPVGFYNLYRHHLYIQVCHFLISLTRMTRIPILARPYYYSTVILQREKH